MIDTQICHYCEEETENPTQDHIYPLSKIRIHVEKGEEVPVDLHKNKVWACEACNMNKGNYDYDSFKALGIPKIRHLKKIFLCRQIKNARRGRKRPNKMKFKRKG